MSAERLAVGDLVRCLTCGRWHPAMQPSSGSATDYAERMLYYKCGEHLFYVGQIDGTARDPTRVKAPLELELWLVTKGGRTLSCELRFDANGGGVMVRSGGEALFSGCCTSEEEEKYVANGLKQDELKTGWRDVSPS